MKATQRVSAGAKKPAAPDKAKPKPPAGPAAGPAARPKPKPKPAGPKKAKAKKASDFGEVKAQELFPADSAAPGPRSVVLARDPKTRRELRWVPGRTAYDPKKATNVYVESALLLSDGRRPTVLARGGRLSYDRLKLVADKIDAAFGRPGLTAALPVSKTLILK